MAETVKSQCEQLLEGKSASSTEEQTERGPYMRKPKRVRTVVTRMQNYKIGPLSVLRHCVEQQLKVKVWTRNYKHVRGICNGYIVAFDKHWNLAMIDVEETYLNPVPTPVTKLAKKRTRHRMQGANSQEVTSSDKVRCEVETCVRDFCQPSLNLKDVDLFLHGSDVNKTLNFLTQATKSSDVTDIRKVKFTQSKSKENMTKQVSSNENYETVLSRHVKQLFLRGDNVVLVAIV